MYIVFLLPFSNADNKSQCMCAEAMSDDMVLSTWNVKFTLEWYCLASTYTVFGCIYILKRCLRDSALDCVIHHPLFLLYNVAGVWPQIERSQDAKRMAEGAPGRATPHGDRTPHQLCSIAGWGLAMNQVAGWSLLGRLEQRHAVTIPTSNDTDA